jgi:hypothetical protein
MKKYLIPLACLLSSFYAIAQDTAIECKHYAWGVYPCLTYYHMDFKQINSVKWMLGRPNNNQLMIGGGVNYGNPGSFYVSADFSTDILHEREASGAFGSNPVINVDCYSYRLSINTYYLLLGTKNIGFYGNLGTSFERILLYSENHNTVNPTDTFSTFENCSLKQNFLLNGGISLYFYNKKLGFATGVLAFKAGYNWAPMRPSVSSWYTYDGNTKTEGNPVISFNGFYMGIMLNVWVIKNNKCAFH